MPASVALEAPPAGSFSGRSYANPEDNDYAENPGCGSSHKVSLWRTVLCATVTRQGSWSGGSTTWVPIDVDLGSISIPTNRVLQIRVTVGTASSDAMMLAYDTTAYPSRVTVG